MGLFYEPEVRGREWVKVSVRDLERKIRWFHLSKLPHEGKMVPRIPGNVYVDKDQYVIEDQTTPRISVSPSLRKAIQALVGWIEGGAFWVFGTTNRGIARPVSTCALSHPGNPYGEDFSWRKYALHWGLDPEDDKVREEHIKGCVPDAGATGEGWITKRVVLPRLGVWDVSDREVRLSPQAAEDLGFIQSPVRVASKWLTR